MGRLMAVLTSAVFAACAGPQFDSVQEAQMDAAMARTSEIHACQAAYPKRERGRAADGVRCMNAVNVKYPPPVQIADIERVAAFKTLDAAERYDSGKLSDTQFDAEIAAIKAEFQFALQGRQAQAMAVSAANQQAASARQQAAMQSIMAGAAIMSGSTAPPPQPLPMPRQTNCNTYGSRTNCTTW